VKDTLNVPEVKEIAKELGITPAQVVISWHVQRGVRFSSSSFSSVFMG
jgi:diketogulonate reductase-like aldo/keto reductase